MNRRLGFLLVVGLAMACGKTVFTRERFACASAGDCADGYVCRADECQLPLEDDAGTVGGGGGAIGGGGGAIGGGGGSTGGGGGGGSTGGGDGGVADGGVAGAGCTTSASCATGLTCVDAVCCRTACGAACDSCNLPGNAGTCLPRPAGASAPSCNGYACNGTQVSCVASCSPDAGVNGCNPGFTCLSPTCRRCWSALTDDFSLAADPAWSLSGANITGGRLVVDVSSRNGMPTTRAATSVEALPLVGCGVSFALEVPPVAGTGYVGNAELFVDNAARRPAFGWRFDTRGLVAAWTFSDGGVGERVLYDAGVAPPRWLRLEESGGEVRWRTTSTTSFSTVHSVTHTESLTGLKLEFNGSYPAQQGSQTTYEIDQLNLGP